MPIPSGILAPDFEALDDTGKIRKLSEFRGQPVVLYFYPKDDTPGCTTEACGFRDAFSDYVQAGIALLGISPDKVKSHAKFKAKYNLPFILLADEEHKIAEAYGVWGPKKFMGKEYEGVYRTTFVLDPAGQIVKVFENVKPDGHSAEVLAALK